MSDYTGAGSGAEHDCIVGSGERIHAGRTSNAGGLPLIRSEQTGTNGAVSGAHVHGGIAPTRLLVVEEGSGAGTRVASQFSRQGYDVAVAADAESALSMLAAARTAGPAVRFAALVCAHGADGCLAAEVVPRALADDPQLTVLTVGEAPDTGGEIVYRLTRRIAPGDVVREVGVAVGRRPQPRQSSEVGWPVVEASALSPALCEHEQHVLRDLSVQIAEMLTMTMEAKNVFLRGHSQRVGALAADIAEELGLEPDVVEQVRLAGRLHDVGKIGVREDVLNKVSPLTPEEFAHIQTHVAKGTEILAPLQHLGPTLTYIGDHHERWDGTGYPAGLAGEAISLGGRIITAADAFDALTSERPYRAALSRADAVTLLESLVGQLLDPDVFQALRAVVQRPSSLIFVGDT